MVMVFNQLSDLNLTPQNDPPARILLAMPVANRFDRIEPTASDNLIPAFIRRA